MTAACGVVRALHVELSPWANSLEMLCGARAQPWSGLALVSSVISDRGLSPPRLSDHDVVASSQGKANLAKKIYPFCEPANVARAFERDLVLLESRVPRHELLGELTREPQRSQIRRFSLLPQWTWAIVRPKL